MTAPSTRSVGPTRAPPPTPIATGKGTRSAASNDRVLSDFLDSSLRVPDLTLPEPYFPPKSPFPVVDVASIRRLVAAAAEIGAFVIDGRDLLRAEDVRDAIEAARGVLEAGSGCELYWGDNIGSETEAALPSAGYRIFRKEMKNVESKLENCATTIIKVLSENIQHQNHSKEFKKLNSVLRLRKYDSSDRLKGDTTKDHQDHYLRLIVGDCTRVRSEETSSSFILYAGFILVIISKPFQDWSNNELKAYNSDILLEPIEGQPVPISLELICSPQLHQESYHSTISILDQLLMMLVFILLYKLCY